MRFLLGLVICSIVCCFLLVDSRVEGRPLEGAVAAPITSSELIDAISNGHHRARHANQKRRKVRREVENKLENFLKGMIGDESKVVPLRPGK